MTDLPNVLPVFPLTGSLLLPGGILPLHIFEPRYCHMVEDALESGGLIGMVQPRVANPADNRGEAELDESTGGPLIYGVGCAGVIEQHQDFPSPADAADAEDETAEDRQRYVIVLRGVSRFRIRVELPMQRGYRRVEAAYEEFERDLEEHRADVEPEPLLEALRGFSRQQGVKVDLDRLAEVPGVALLNGLAMSLPLAPPEKQALLEAADIQSRNAMLLTLLEMGVSIDDDQKVAN